MDVHVSSLKSWIEDLSAKNKSLEKEIETLKNTSSNSIKQLEQENTHLKKENESLKLVEEENIQFKQQIELLKLEIIELTKGPEVVDLSSDSEDGNNEQSNSKKRRRIESGELDLGGIPDGPSGQSQSETPPIQNNPLMAKDFLSIFMNFVTPRDLGACRLVSRMWNVDATKQMKTKCTFRLDCFYPEKVERFLQIAPTTFSGFRRLIFDTSIMELPKENLNKLFMDHGKSLHRVRLQFGLWEGFGMNEFRDSFLASLQEIKSLSLQRFPCALLHKAGIFHRGYQGLPNLTEIYIGFESTCTQRIHEGTQVFADILRMAPNLKSFHWEEKQNGRGRRVDGTKMMIESLVQINPPKLEYVYLHSEIGPDVVTFLANSQLNLKRLYFSELNGFEVHLFAPSTGCDIELTPLRTKYFQMSRQALKEYLEKELAKFEEVLCIELLNMFLSLLAAKLAQSGG